MNSTAHRVLHVGDVAGVASTLADGLERHTTWQVTRLPLPEHGAGSNIAIRSMAWPARAVTTWRRVARTLDTEAFSVVHLHWARYAPFVRTGDVPLVVHAHGSDVRGRRSSWMGRLVERSLSRADLVLASTPDLLNDLPDGSVYLPNPVDIDLFVPPGDSRSDSVAPTIVVFARLTEVKGADTILEAVRMIRSERADASIVAFGGSAPYVDRARDLGVQFVSPADRPEIAHVLGSASVVIGQQRIGSLGLSELEAMSCGRPVIARTDIDRYPTAPPVLDAHDADAVASICMTLLDDPARRHELGRAARDYVVANHGPGPVAERLAGLYDTLRTGS
jgi:glycosyltransferase involved in cell wall biosynthesis